MNESHLLDALRAKLNHQPRTRYWSAAGQPKYTNALILSESPYLLHHAHNPVDWRVWSDEAFEEARSAEKPIFLSIGYSTCHWCQVMARESFEDLEIAEALNSLFIPIKVDREELPDVDAVYMEFLQITTGEGGWPMNLFLTPERRPLFASTYLPARDGDRDVKVGLYTYLKVMAKSWRDPRLVAQGEAPLRVLREYALQPPVAQLNSEWLTEAAQAWMSEHDDIWGGFTAPPKFLRPAMLEALLRAWSLLGDPSYLKAVETTLERLYCGGIYDQLGGGMSRYSVDNRWWLPHFEKMLYDNAQLVTIALETFQVTRRPLFEHIARDTLRFIERELQVSNGAWAAAIDSESVNDRADRIEGYFYTWSYAELESALSQEELEWVVATFGVERAGNIQHHSAIEKGGAKRPVGEVKAEGSADAESSNEQAQSSSEEDESTESPLSGRNLLRLYEPLDAEERVYWEPLRERLYQLREQRAHPTRDEQVICAWNAFALSAFARAAVTLADPHYLLVAQTCARFLTSVMWDGAQLKRVWRAQGDPDAASAGVLEDYMAMVIGLLDLFEASGEVESLYQAIEIYEAAERFFDQERGGFFRCPPERRAGLIYEEKPLIDGVEPSGNALAALAALRLHQLTDLPHYRAQADSTLKAIGSVMGQQPTASPKALSALAAWFNHKSKLVVTQVPRDTETIRHPLSEASWQAFLPYTTRLTLSHIGERLRAQVPALAQLPPEVESARAFICSMSGCTPPVTQVSTLRASLSKLDS